MQILSFLPENFEEIATSLRSGRPVVLPTDTSYGFSGSIFHKASVLAVEKIKGRENKPFLALVSSAVEMSRYSDTKDVQNMDIFTDPQEPTTFLLPKKNTIPESYFPDFDLIGLRIPLYNPLLGFLEFFGEPIFSTSANFSGEPAIYSHLDIVEKFSHIPNLLFVSVGDLPVVPSSKIVRVEDGKVDYLR